MNKLLTLCFVLRGDEVLLGFKKIGFGAGRWNGFGGKVESLESVETAAMRELKEEAGIEAQDLSEVAVIEFAIKGIPQIHEVHVFTVTAFVGEPTESDEMRPQWFKQADIPYDHMWPDDRVWLPLLLQGKKLRAKFELGDADVIVSQEVNEL